MKHTHPRGNWTNGDFPGTTMGGHLTTAPSPGRNSQPSIAARSAVSCPRPARFRPATAINLRPKTLDVFRGKLVAHRQVLSGGDTHRGVDAPPVPLFSQLYHGATKYWVSRLDNVKTIEAIDDIVHQAEARFAGQLSDGFVDAIARRTDEVRRG